MANATLILDLGNSSTKAIVKFDDGRSKFEEMMELSNAFALLPQKYRLSSDYTSDKSTILKMNTFVELGSIKSPVKGYFSNGELQEREQPDSVIKPSARVSKWELKSTPLSLHLVFLRASLLIAKHVGVQNPNDIGITWNVMTLLPPGDYLQGKSKYIEMISSITHISSFLPKVELDVKVESVKVIAEGFGAYISVVYKNGKELREECKHLATSSILVVDIGGGTTDIIVIKDNRVIQDSKFTIDIGGNNVLQLVRTDLLAQGLTYDDNDLKKAILDGYIMDGTKKLNIQGFIDKARKEISRRIVAQFNNYLEGTSIKMRTIGYILFCGGGSTKEGNKDSLIDDMIISLNELAPNSELVTIPKFEVCKKEVTSAMMNLVGAYILSEVV